MIRLIPHSVFFSPSIQRYTRKYHGFGCCIQWPFFDQFQSELKLMADFPVEKVTGETYNFTLVNYYASGTDSISYHSDSESFLGPEPCIASLSLGSSRDFLLRHTAHKTNGAPTEKFSLQDGDMVVMRKGTQANWMHSIPKRMGKGVGGRINITFRKGVVKYATKNYLDYNVGKGAMYRWKGGEMVEQKGV